MLKFLAFLHNIPRHYVSQVDGGDYVSLEIGTYTKGSNIDIYCAFNSTEDLDSFSYQYKFSDSMEMFVFLTGSF